MIRTIAFAICCLLVWARPASAEIVQTCRVGGSAFKQIEILRDSKVYDTYIYYIRERDGQAQPIFGNKEDSHGTNVRIQCAGLKTRALVLSGEFTANALQGVVLTYNRDANRIERLDFAEKARPQWLYLGERTTLVVIPTLGRGETDKKYVAYRHVVGAGDEVQVDAVDALPPRVGFDVVRLRR